MNANTMYTPVRARVALAALLIPLSLGALAGCSPSAPAARGLASSDRALTAFIFLSTECPLSQNYTKPLNELRSAYDLATLDLVGVFPLSDDDDERVEAFCKKYPVQFSTRLDHGYELVYALRASVTPEVFLLGRDDELIYSGKIDNWAVELGKTRRVATAHYLKDAIDAHLQGRAPSVDHVDPVGCFLPEEPYVAQTE